MARGCPDCRFWQPTEMFSVPTTDAPHHKVEADHRTEMMRATTALCTWPADSGHGAALVAAAPPWLVKRVGGGDLTSEDDGKNCCAFEQRRPLSFAGLTATGVRR